MSRSSANHSAFCAHQDKLDRPADRRDRGPAGTLEAAGPPRGRRAIAADFKLYDIMERRGYSRAEADHCLANDALMKQIVASSAKDWDLPEHRGHARLSPSTA